MTSVLVKGTIRTFDPTCPTARSIVLRDGVVAEINSENCETDSVLQLAPGETLQPGWRDDHTHLLSTLATRCSVDLSEVGSIDQLLQRLAVSAPGRNGWLRGARFEPSFLKEQRNPTRADLDSVASEFPIVLHDQTGHVAVVNTKAARELGVPEDSDGVLVEREDILSRAPRLDWRDLTQAASLTFQDWAQKGLVAITDATHTNDASSLQTLGELLVICEGPQITAMVGVDRLGNLRYGDVHNGVRVGHAKVMPDVAVRNDISGLIKEAHEKGFPVAIHVMDIDVLEEVLQALSKSAPPVATQDRLEHCSLALPEQLDRVAELGLRVCTQPSFLLHRLKKYVLELSPIEQQWLWPLASLLDRQIDVSLSSDSPVVPADPEEWIQVATDRPIAHSEEISDSEARTLTIVSPMEVGMPSDLLVTVSGSEYGTLASRN